MYIAKSPWQISCPVKSMALVYQKIRTKEIIHIGMSIHH